jgi:hypothetical protein
MSYYVHFGQFDGIRGMESRSCGGTVKMMLEIAKSPRT